MNNQTVTITIDKYENMVHKIARFNILVSMIRTEIDRGNKYPVDDKQVLTLTGLAKYKAEKEAKET